MIKNSFLFIQLYLKNLLNKLYSLIIGLQLNTHNDVTDNLSQKLVQGVTRQPLVSRIGK